VVQEALGMQQQQQQLLPAPPAAAAAAAVGRRRGEKPSRASPASNLGMMRKK